MIERIRYRQIHLDFHTSEHINDAGANFNPQEFTDTLEMGNVNSVTLFARCHHGWCYYPSKVGKPHPHLVKPDLLGEMIRACRAKDIAVPIYLSVQWDERMAREHPEWRVMSADNTASHWPGQEPSTMNQLTATWHTLCLENKEYTDYLIELGLELIELYDAEGFFLDILSSHECVCPKCLSRMKRDGLNPTASADRRKNDNHVNMAFIKAFSDAMKEKKRDIRLFFNSGHIFKGERDRYRYYSHLELESLPTGGWGYDHFPLSARYADTLGLDMLGMTGKFHTHWGEFGGFKRPAALEFECAQMISLGSRCSIGDQLHPSGRLDPATYDIIGPAYARVKKMEPYLLDSKYQAQIAILSSEAVHAGSTEDEKRISESDAGAARILLELHYPFDVIDTEDDFSKYRLIILPDNITCDDALTKSLENYLAGGGKTISSGSSGMDPKNERFVLNTGMEYHGERSTWNPDYLRADKDFDQDVPATPIVMYAPPFAVKAGNNRSHAECRRPYFNRTWEHFCSHLHSPCYEGAAPYGDAVIETEQGFYFAHEIFKLYYQYGQPLYKYLFRGALERLIPHPLIRTSLPSAGRVSLLKQELENRYLVNVLYAPSQNRGSRAATHKGKNTIIEIIEDVPELREVHLSIHIPEKPIRIHEGYSGAPLLWQLEEGRILVTIPTLHIHGAVVIEYEKQ